MKSIYPCIWLSQSIEEIKQYYQNVFPKSKIKSSNEYAILLEILGDDILFLTGNTECTPNASISIMITTDSEDELNSYWEKITQDGIVIMKLGAYPWSKRYGWAIDKFGVTWQFYLGDLLPNGQRLVPQLMFLHHNNGKAMEAMEFYTQIFPNSAINSILKYKDGNEHNAEPPEHIQHASMTLDGYTVFCNDFSYDHTFNFNNAISLIVTCADQSEINHYWDRLIDNIGKEQSCGWLKDRYGVSWQIIPHNMEQLFSNPNNIDKLRNMKRIVLDELS